MNILLLNPPFLPSFSREQRSPAVTKSGTLYYPMWLCYAAGLLQSRGHQVKVVAAPATGETLSWLEKLMTEFQPDVTVIDTSTPSIHKDVQTAHALKSAHPATFMVLVGPHVSALPESSIELDDAIDAAAIQEYEHTLVELCEALTSRGDILAVPGLCVRSQGQIRRTPARPLAHDLDSLPMVSQVYKQHLDYRRYFYSHSKHPLVVTLTGRGCPYQCIYCVYPQTFSGHLLRYRSVDRVIEEIEFILKEFPDVREIMFEDDTLTINRRRCEELAEAILKRNLRFVWSANSRADVDLATLKLLKRAGARLFCVGVESGDQQVLNNMKKSLEVGRIRQFFRDTKKAGILVHGCFLVGNPGETKATLEITLRLAKELNPDTAQFFPIMVYPGTAAWQWAVENNYLATRDFSQWLTPAGLHNCILTRPELSNTELVEFCDRARREYYLRPGYLVSKLVQGLRDPHELKRLVKGGITLSRHLFRGWVGKAR